MEAWEPGKGLQKVFRFLAWAAAAALGGLVVGQGGTDAAGRCLCPFCTGFGLNTSSQLDERQKGREEAALPQVPKS